MTYVHQNAGDARTPFAFGGSGSARQNVKIAVTEEQLETADFEWHAFKCAKAGYVSNFALRSTDVDDATGIVLDVGIQGTSATDDDEFIADATVGQAGGLELTNVVDESTEAGFPVAAGDIIYLSVSTVATTGVDGEITLSFDYTVA